MLMQPVGRARTDIELVDLSVLISTGLQGIAAVHGITERGPEDEAVLVGSLDEYLRNFGGETPESDFWLICRRALERGGRLLISRATHYTDPADKGTRQGSKATLSLATPTTAQFTIEGAAGQIDDIGYNDGLPFSLVSGIPFDTDIDTTAANLVEALTGSITGATAQILDSSGGVVTIELSLPAEYDGATFLGSGSGGITVTGLTDFEGSVALGDFEADNIGAWGNGLSITIVPAINGNSDEFDITIDLDGYPQLSQTIYNVAATLTQEVIDNFNNQSNLLDISSTSVGVTLQAVATTYLSGGAENKTLIVEADFIGDATAGTGFHIFSNYNNFVRISVPEKAIPNIDIALAAYAEARKDCRAILRTPLGINGTTGIDYREGTGVYEHTAINTYYASMVFGGLKVAHPTTQLPTFVTALGDYLGASTVKDNLRGMWYAVAGSKRGKLKNVLGVDYNLGSPARAAEADNVDIRGINQVIDDDSIGVVIWGNSTLYKQNTLLKHENVADLWVFINRGLGPLVKSEIFDPNDIETWKAITRKIEPFFKLLQRRRGIWKYLIQGDQNIDDISQLGPDTLNQPSNVDNGQYFVNLWVAPKVGAKYIGLRVIITNSGVNFEELAGQPTVV